MRHGKIPWVLGERNRADGVVDRVDGLAEWKN
jgi:hypothetical protein